MERSNPSLDERIRALKIELMELENEYRTLLYFETMPEYDPMYKYCYTTANKTIPAQHQHIDFWLRAVMMHMATRRAGHGGASTASVLVSLPIGLSEKGVERWFEYANKMLRKQINRYGKR